MRLPSRADILPYLEKKLISEQAHPENPDVRIFNYTQETQFSKAWDDVTMQCRGLIVDVATGEVIAHPFPKFFNYQEHLLAGKEIPKETPIVTAKEDGSLGILYWLDETPWIATRGSFMSDQAQWATKWFREHSNYADWNRDVTYLFEIVFPENRIVLRYDYSGLILLAATHIKSGLDVSVETVAEPFRRYRTYMPDDLEKLAALDLPNEEGFVCFYPQANLRLKVKFAEYVRLHKIVTGLSEIGIWEHLRESRPLEQLLADVPDEFFKWVGSVAFRLTKEFEGILTQAVDELAEISKDIGIDADRKTWAVRIQKMKNPGLGFALLDSKPTAPAIWKMVRPRGQSTYKVDIDS